MGGRQDLENLPTLEVFLCPSDPQRDAFDAPARNNFRGNAGTDVSRFDPAQMAEENDGLFVGGRKVEIRQISDGLSRTALFSETAMGDGDANEVNRLSDWFYIPNVGTADQFFLNCSTIRVGNTGRSQPFSLSGRSWALGSLNNSRYTHLMPPNSQSCLVGGGRGGGSLNGPAADESVQRNGAAATATSWHPSGVHVVFADGHVELVSEEIAVDVWREFGSRGISNLSLQR